MVGDVVGVTNEVLVDVCEGFVVVEAIEEDDTDGDAVLDMDVDNVDEDD